MLNKCEGEFRASGLGMGRKEMLSPFLYSVVQLGRCTCSPLKHARWAASWAAVGLCNAGKDRWAKSTWSENGNSTFPSSGGQMRREEKEKTRRKKIKREQRKQEEKREERLEGEDKQREKNRALKDLIKKATVFFFSQQWHCRLHLCIQMTESKWQVMQQCLCLSGSTAWPPPHP